MKGLTYEDEIRLNKVKETNTMASEIPLFKPSDAALVVALRKRGAKRGLSFSIAEHKYLNRISD